MTNVIIKEELHKYIDGGDDKLLKMMYALIREYKYDDITDEDIKELERRTSNRKSCKSKTYSWQEAKDMITGKTGTLECDALINKAKKVNLYY